MNPEELMEPISTFKIDSAGYTHIPVLIGFWDDEEKQYYSFVKQTEEHNVLWEFICFLREHYKTRTTNAVLWSHRGFQWGNRFIIKELIRQGDKLTESKMDLGWAEITTPIHPGRSKPRIEFRTTAKMDGPESELNALFEAYEPLLPKEYQKPGWSHEKTEPPWEMDDELPTTKAYLERYCKALSGTYRCREILMGLKIGMKTRFTTAGSALGKQNHYYPLEKIARDNFGYEAEIQQATYGGRNEVYRRYGENLSLHDIRFSYVSCYDQPVPIGRLRTIVNMGMEKGTLARATVKVPKDWYIGPLPYHMPEGNVSFPVGEFTSIWDMVELRNAAELGVDITLRDQWGCEEAPILKEFGKFVSELRDKYPEEDFLWKMFGDLLQGKYGQRMPYTTYQHITQIENLVGWMQEDEDAEIFSFLQETPPNHYRPLIPMRIKALGRINHLKYLLEALKHGKIYYGDTDSVICDYRFPQHNPIKPGDLVFKKEVIRGYFIRQKLYGCYIHEEGLPDTFSPVDAGYTDLRGLTEKDYQGFLSGKKEVEGVVRYPPQMKDILSGTEGRITQIMRTKGSYPENRIYEGDDSKPILLGGP